MNNLEGMKETTWACSQRDTILRVCFHMRVISVGMDCESVNSLSIGTLAREI